MPRVHTHTHHYLRYLEPCEYCGHNIDWETTKQPIDDDPSRDDNPPIEEQTQRIRQKPERGGLGAFGTGLMRCGVVRLLGRSPG